MTTKWKSCRDVYALIVMSSTEELFIDFLRINFYHLTRYITISELAAIRIISTTLCDLLTELVFSHICITYTATTFTNGKEVDIVVSKAFQVRSHSGASVTWVCIGKAAPGQTGELLGEAKYQLSVENKK